MTTSGWKLKSITQPAVEPVTLAEAKAQLRVVTSHEDVDIARMIVAAREAAEQYTRRAFVAQVWEAGYERFPDCGVFELAKPSLISVVSVSYTDDDDVEQTLVAGTDYTVDTYSEPGRVIRRTGVTWPTITEAGIRVRVRFMAGFPQGEGSPGDDTENVPEPIRHAILLHVAEMFENRDTAAAMPDACESLLHPYRVYGWGDA